MAMGYEGQVRLTYDGIATYDMALATGGSVPQLRPRLESAAGYGGQISTPVADIGIGTPENYDWEVYDGSVDLELTLDFYENQIKKWIFARQTGGAVRLQSREGNVQQFNKCYWNNITLSASDGAAVTAAISFVAMERDTYTIGGDYIGNKTGDEVFCVPPGYNVPDPLNPSADSNQIPIPYWNTVVHMNGSLVEFVTWTVDLSQEVVKFFSCENNVDPVEPRFVAVGPLTAKFSGDYMFVDTASFAVPDTLLSLDIKMGGDAGVLGELKFEDLELESATDAVQSPDSLAPIAFEYAAYTLAV